MVQTKINVLAHLWDGMGFTYQVDINCAAIRYIRGSVIRLRNVGWFCAFERK